MGLRFRVHKGFALEVVFFFCFFFFFGGGVGSGVLKFRVACCLRLRTLCLGFRRLGQRPPSYDQPPFLGAPLGIHLGEFQGNESP